MKEILQHDRALQLVDTDLISQDYIEAVAEEINSELNETGQLPLGELSRKYTLTGAFLEAQLEPLLGTVIQGKLEHGKLYTNAYIEKQTSLIRGALRGAIYPVPLRKLCVRLKCQDAIFTKCVEQLIEDGEVLGAVMGRRDGGEFVPNVYLEARDHSLKAFLSANGYITFDRLKAAGIVDAKDEAKRLFPSSQMLSCAIISSVRAATGSFAS